jgi:hypothetical protein
MKEIEAYFDDLTVFGLNSELKRALITNKDPIGDWSEIGRLIERFDISLHAATGSWSADIGRGDSFISTDGTHPHIAIGKALLGHLNGKCFSIILSPSQIEDYINTDSIEEHFSDSIEKVKITLSCL